MIKGLPEKLKSLRLKYGLSQKQVSDRIGVSPSIISGYETGERTPSTEVLLSLSYLYRCSTDYLLGKKENNPKNTISTDGMTDRQINALRAFIDSIVSNE
ncbi:MAG: helix-turn-helix transcriptional regulator [Clostridia bacterium]|nr:helix-turn-helix transcriptional regulator [Clostridia bacterium]